jgi:hypothetical protein
MCVRGINFASVSTICRLDFETDSLVFRLGTDSLAFRFETDSLVFVCFTFYQ